MNPKRIAKKHFFHVFASLAILPILFSACGRTAIAPDRKPSGEAALQTTTPAATATATALPTLGLPHLQGTAAPTPAGEINAASAKKIVELARWGKGNIYSSVLSPDGKTLAVASSTGIYLYDAVTLKRLDRLGNDLSIAALFSPDGKRLAVKTNHNQISVYSFDQKLWTQLMSEPEDSAFTDDHQDRPNFSFNPDGNYLAVQWEDVITLYDCDNGSVEKSFDLNVAWNQSPTIKFTPDGQRLILLEADLLIILDTQDFQEVARVSMEYPKDLDLSTDGKILVVSYGHYSPSNMEETLILDAHSGEILDRIQFPMFGIQAAGGETIGKHVLISPNDEILAIAYSHHPVCLWSLTEKKPIQCLAEFDSLDVDQIVFSPDGKWLYTTKYGRTNVYRWDTDTWNLSKVIGRENSGIIQEILVPEAPDDRLIVQQLEAYDFQILLYLEQPERYLSFETQSDVRDLCYSSDGSLIVTAADEGVGLWSADDGQLMGSLPGDALVVKLSTDGSLLATAFNDNSIKIFLMPDGYEKFILEGHTSPVNRFYFLPDFDALVSTSANELIVWDLLAGQPIDTLSQTSVLHVLPAERGFVTLNSDLTGEVWEMGKQQPVMKLESPHPEMSAALAMEYGGMNLASLDGESISLVDLNRWETIWSTSVQMNQRPLVRFTQDGERIVLAGSEHVLVLNSSDGSVLQNLPITTSVMDVSRKNDSLASASGNQVEVWTSIGSGAARMVDGFVSEISESYLAYLSNTDSDLIPKRIQHNTSDLLVAGFRGYQKWISPKDGRQLAGMDLDPHTDRVAFSEDGKLLAVSSLDDNDRPVVRLQATGSEPETPPIFLKPSHSNIVVDGETVLSLSNSGRVAAIFNPDSYGSERYIDLWDGMREDPVKTLPGALVALSADGNLLAVVQEFEYGYNLILYDITRLAVLEEIQTVKLALPDGAFFSPTALTFNPEGTQLALGGLYGNILLLNAQSGEVETQLEGHSGSITGLIYLRDGKTLVSQSMDGTLRLWGVSNMPASIE